ncbi:MAG: dipeptidase PepV [Solobacterium sp.]|nr:dipeptidase PepV [Solobacterium sp.]
MSEIQKLIAAHEEELIQKLSGLVRINSVESEPLADAPFGAGPRDALLAALAMMEKDGFKTVNLDNYAGYAEMGEGEQVIGIIGHLDIVPAAMSDGWDTDPFEPVIRDGVIYGRGVADDKGAVVASMIAMKVLREMNVPLNKRIRLIMGTNEETGSKCLAHYVAKEGHVDLGFTPDGEFPGVHGEKGMIAGVYRSKQTNIRYIQGGTAKNVVCPKCTVRVDKISYSTKALTDWFHNNSIQFTIENTDEYDEITVIGNAAHASTPELGINAISYLMMGLKQAGFQDPFVDFYCSRFGLYYDGTGMGCSCSDEYGALTWNNGLISMKDGVIEGTIDIRFPVQMSARSVVRMMQDNLDHEGGSVEIRNTAEPLFFPQDSQLVQALYSAYTEVTGDTEHEPMTIGGGTYAKGIHNTIAFGCAFPDKDYRIHNTNEYCPIDELLKQAEIYVRAIQNLLAI